jgi:5-methylcytosine-specific restriction endonuclease McrA
MKPFAEKFYKSKAWRQCRQAFFTSKYGLCNRCGGAGKIVHHKILLNPYNIDDPNITLNPENLELLCQDCHNKEHHEKYGVTASDLMFDVNGNLVPKNI